jgi:hypothetical protein
MNERTFCNIAGTIFALVALLHLLRIALGWPIVIDTWFAPMWASWAGLVIGATLAFYGFSYGMTPARSRPKRRPRAKRR